MILDKLSIKSKFVFILLAVALFCIAAIGIQSLNHGKQGLTERIYAQLSSARENKRSQVETYFSNLHNQVEILASGPTIVGAMREFSSAFQRHKNAVLTDTQLDSLKHDYKTEFLPRLSPNVDGTPLLEHYLPNTPAAQYLQYQFISSNPNPKGKKQELMMAEDRSYYSGVHQHYHPFFANAVAKLGYYDLFLIDLKTGDIVYSVAKETDFATSLTDGPYSTSNLAKLFRSVNNSQDHGDVKLVDFDFYRPSYNTPAAFLGTTIYDDQKKAIGVLAIQVSNEKLDQVLAGNQRWEQKGLGKTGETILVGSDRLMRSNSRLLLERDDCYRTSDDAISQKLCRLDSSTLLQSVDNVSVDRALDGKTGETMIKSYYGAPVLSAYAPLSIAGMDWAIISEIERSEANAPIYQFQRNLTISAVILASLVTFLAMWIAYRFTAPISALMKGVKALGKGDRDINIELNRQDEYGELAQAFNKTVHMINQQRDIIERKNKENESLLLNILPTAVAKRVREGEQQIADHIDNVTVMFSAMKGFSAYSETLSPKSAIQELNTLISSFDKSAEKYGVEKVKTIGDSYMAASGLTIPRLDHAQRCVDYAREMLSIMHRYNLEHGTHLGLRIGIHSGPILAGIVGQSKFVYDLWGDSVNIASRIRFEADINTLMISDEVYERLNDTEGFCQCGPMKTKGMGPLSTWQWAPEWEIEEADTELIDSNQEAMNFAKKLGDL